MHTVPRYIPKNSEALNHPDKLGVVFIRAFGTGRWEGIAYKGYAGRRSWHYSFRSREEAETAAKNFFLSLSEWKARQSEWRRDRNRPHALKAGDIVYNSWGWEQTNIDFYQVVRATTHFVWLRRLAQETTETGFMQGRTVPLLGKFSSEEVKKHHATTGAYGDSIHFKHGAGSKWDGRALGCSWYA